MDILISLLTVIQRLQPRAVGRLSGIFMLALLMTIGRPATAIAQVDEADVKAAFLYKFVNYVEWPPRAFQDADSALMIGVLDADAIADHLVQLVAGRWFGARPIVVRKLRHSDSLSGLHVLFIGGSDNIRLGQVLATTKGHAVLTVTEAEQGLTFGSVINFVVVDNKVRFDVAPPSGPDNLKVSARLLAVARKVVVSPS